MAILRTAAVLVALLVEYTGFVSLATKAGFGHAELARGDATAPPSSIDVLQQEHALRHLAWLRQDDPTISDLLDHWSEALSGYIPEPFRAFGGPPL